MKLIQILLFPFSLFYAGIIFLRNRLFDWGILSSRKAVVPTLVVGNLSLGGTGKTPVTEYILKLMGSTEVRIAFLSRGYGRKTNGFVASGNNHTALTVGDEPDQIMAKFPSVPAAVCEDRLGGIQRLKELNNDIQWVVLDDAYQHRRLRPDFTVLLTDFNRPFYEDVMLPAGTLRDNRMEKRRANVIIVTKCPPSITEKERESIISKIKPSAAQDVFFASLVYGSPQPVFPSGKIFSPQAEILGFSGIARPESFRQHLLLEFFLKKFESFPDHHLFTASDLKGLKEVLDTFVSPDKALITTEKDARRIRTSEGWNELPVFYIPVEIRFIVDENKFNELILREIKQR